VEPFFPFVSVPPPASHGASATAAFKKALETGGPHAGRRVKIDFSQSANPGDKGRRNANDGTRDIGNSPAPVLLLRGLDSLAGPGAITQAMRAAEGPNKEGAKGMRRIILIKDKVTMASWGFGFVEFIDTAVGLMRIMVRHDFIVAFFHSLQLLCLRRLCLRSSIPMDSVLPRSQLRSHGLRCTRFNQWTQCTETKLA
jgi:hypothetical protein